MSGPLDRPADPTGTLAMPDVDVLVAGPDPGRAAAQPGLREGDVSVPNLSVPCATVTTTLPRPQSSNTCSARSMTRALLPTGGRVRTWPPYVPADEPEFPTDPFNQSNLRPDPADVVIYSDITEIHAELRDLGEARKQWRRHRWAITNLRIAVIVLFALAFGVDPLWGIGAIGLGVYTVNYDIDRDASTRRGRELDADIAAAKGRLREKLASEEAS